ncbi:helix-turn-helix transcriptional regulator [Bacillus mycoides]|uniref:helix-turn-helix transcriptional regulator n=1 Tax=Bacillus cereus group TaxID=86661 RepID=UPI0002EF5D4B|nr:helix-turn-helix transcriptional regulator [Bacillus mycoides]
MKIGKKIRQIRIHREMTQGELIDGICSIPYLSRVENGTAKPSLSFLEKVSAKLDISVDYLTKQNKTDFEATILAITINYKENNKLTESEISLLELHTREMHPLPILLKIFGILLHHYVCTDASKKANSIYQQSIHLISNQPNQLFAEDFSYYYIACGNYFYMKQDFIKTNEYYEQANQLLTSEENLQRAHLYYNLSLVKQRLIKDQSISRKYSKKAYELFNKLNNKVPMTDALITMAVQYHLDGKYEESLQCLQEAEGYVKEFQEPAMYFAMIYYNYGRVYQGLKQFDQAIQHFNHSLQINASLDHQKENIYSLRSLIEIYLHLKEWEQMNKVMLEAIKILEAYDTPSVSIEIHAYKAHLYKMQGDSYSYEKEMQRIIDFGIANRQYIQVKKLATELGDHFYELRAYKLGAKYFKIALQCDLDIEDFQNNF